MDEGLRNLLWAVFFIIPIILLLGSWVFGSRIGDKQFSKKYLKESFYSFRILIMFYFQLFNL
tara:strand:+ start:281 stop:466 length:186 start_codon:yes stop_codon:yes gene_type:complete